MIQALYLFDNNSTTLAQEQFGARPFPLGINNFITSFAELISNGKDKIELGFAEFGPFQVLYKTDGIRSLFMVADYIDFRDGLLAILEKIWNRSNTIMSPEKMYEWRSSIFDIVFGQSIKISVFGRPAVGKTTLASYLLKDTIPLVYHPTIGVEIRHVPTGLFGNHTGVVIWDIAGQSQFSSLWPIYLKNSHLILITTDSGLESVLWSRRKLKFVSNWAPNAALLGIANKQDYSIALTAERVESILGIPTEGIVALEPLDKTQRSRLMNQIANQLGIDLGLQS
ncbi:MAG: ADP-ribosylation factor-like protein [Candidatus Thorarchaeota archaeon]